MVRSRLSLHWALALGLTLSVPCGQLAAQEAPEGLGNEPVDLSPLLAAPIEEADEYEAPESEEQDYSYDNHTKASDELANGEAEAEVEVIRERFPNRRVKIEREVTQDEYGNYVNHGSWKQFDEAGTLIAQGQYQQGERDGVWHRWHQRRQSRLFSQAPYNGFKGPFISQAKFADGKLNGNWTIFDGKQDKISQWAFVDGQRHGQSTWWYANGRKLREVTYRDGLIDGQAKQWSPDGTIVSDDKYIKGRKLAQKVTYHSSSQKKTEGTYLFATIVIKTPDDWWNAKTATFGRQGEDAKHGLWQSWYRNGQEHVRGKYRHDTEVGKFTWWYANGQKALEGSYVDGKPDGRWIWWHENGQKATQGAYRAGQLTGRWLGWTADGKLARQEDHTNGNNQAAVAAPQLENLKR